MMSAVYNQKGATFRIDILKTSEVQNFINTHSDILNASMQKSKMSDKMRSHLENSNYVFSGMKTFHELNEAFPSLLDSDGNRKTFEQFSQDVQKIDNTYNVNYLRSEYDFVQASSMMAGKWEKIEEDGDDYNLQYRTAGDDRVREEHAALEGITLPPSDAFWDSYYPPNGWNCRCTVVQVLKDKYQKTNPDKAAELGTQALNDNKMFRFNSGKQQRSVPDYNPYTIKNCSNCDVANKKTTLAKPLNSPLCQACILLRQMSQKEKTVRLTTKERYKIRKAATQWADKHLDAIPTTTGVAKRLVITNHETKSILNKRFFEETFAKNKNNPLLAKTMQLATKIPEWFPSAQLVRTEKGIDHPCDFKVYNAEVDGLNIECKIKVMTNDYIYTMRIIE